MDIARVKGTVVATRKDSKLSGSKLLLLEMTDMSGNDKGGAQLVAMDNIDAGVGDLVLVVRGSSARQAKGMSNTPVDAIVIGIIDNIDFAGKMTYTASQ